MGMGDDKQKEIILRPTERVRSEDAPPLEVQAGVLSTMIERLSVQLERVNFAEYVNLTQKPKRVIWLNFMGGVARGAGVGVGFSIIGAILVLLLQELAVLQLPFIGDYIAEIVRIVNAQMHTPMVQ
jgi:hypothetical protein